MLPRRTFLISGIFFIFLGFLFLLNSFSGITGFVVFESPKTFTNSLQGLIGTVFVVGGILLFMATRGKISRLESEAIVSLHVTKPFEKAIRGHNLSDIDNALAKIGTGKGNEHPLKGQLAGHYSIDAGKGERVIFDYDNPQHTSATLITYLPDHEYKRLQR